MCINVINAFEHFILCLKNPKHWKFSRVILIPTPSHFLWVSQEHGPCYSKHRVHKPSMDWRVRSKPESKLSTGYEHWLPTSILLWDENTGDRKPNDNIPHAIFISTRVTEWWSLVSSSQTPTGHHNSYVFRNSHMWSEEIDSVLQSQIKERYWLSCHRWERILLWEMCFHTVIISQHLANLFFTLVCYH